MELVGILLALRRRWVLVCLGALAAVAIGVLASHRVSLAPPSLEGRATDSGTARVEVLVDTPHSLLATAETMGDDTIATRAALLGSLLARDDVRAAIARGARVEPAELAVDLPDLGGPIETPLSRSAIETARPNAPNVLTLDPEDPSVPIVSIAVASPDPAIAGRLAKSATTVLGYLAGRGQAARQRSVELDQLGPVVVERVASRPAPVKAVTVAGVLFVLWCAAVVVLDRITRGPRRRAAGAGGDAPSRAAGALALASVQPRNGSARGPAGRPGG